MTPWNMGNTSTGHYLRDISDEELQKERESILKCTVDDIKMTGQILKDCIDKGYLCVVGNSTRIDRERDLFGELVDLFG